MDFPLLVPPPDAVYLSIAVLLLNPVRIMNSWEDK